MRPRFETGRKELRRRRRFEDAFVVASSVPFVKELRFLCCAEQGHVRRGLVQTTSRASSSSSLLPRSLVPASRRVDRFVQLDSSQALLPPSNNVQSAGHSPPFSLPLEPAPLDSKSTAGRPNLNSRKLAQASLSPISFLPPFLPSRVHPTLPFYPVRVGIHLPTTTTLSLAFPHLFVPLLSRLDLKSPGHS